MRITAIEVICRPFSSGTWLDQTRLSTPLSWSSRHAERRSTWRGPGSDLVWVLIRTDRPGCVGLGQARGGAVTAALIREHFGALLVGRELSGIEALAATLRDAALPYARGALEAMATSAIELALWDAHARSLGIPLVALLGGAAEDAPRHYLTAPTPEALSSAPDQLLADAIAVKVPATWGPHDGSAATSAQLRQVEAMRELLPDQVPLAIDCFMSWDVPFTRAVATQARDLGIAWIEEPLRPDDGAGYRELRGTLDGIAIAGGEHLAGLGEALRFVGDRWADIVQPDVTWCGGLTTALTIARAAHAGGLTFAPHGGGTQPWTLHLLAAIGRPSLTEILLDLGPASMPSVDLDAPGIGVDPREVGFE